MLGPRVSCAASPVSPLNTAAATVSADFCSALLVAGLGPAAASEVVMSSLSSLSVLGPSVPGRGCVQTEAGCRRRAPGPLMRVPLPLVPLLVSVANTACTLHSHPPSTGRAADNRFQEVDNLT